MRPSRLLFCWALLALPLLTGFSGCFDERVRKPQSEFTGSPSTLWGYVDTRFGSGGPPWVAGHTTPAAQKPLGMVRLGPDTTSLGKITGSGGYNYADVSSLGFSHMRLSGTGLWEGGVLRVLPVGTPGLGHAQAKKFAIPFIHGREAASPGYYRMSSIRRAMTAELTATERVGFHRYTFREQVNPALVLDLASHLNRGGSVTNMTATLDVPNARLTGEVRLFDGFSSRYGGRRVFFAIQLPPSFQAARFFDESGNLAGLTATKAAGPFWTELRFNAPAETAIDLQVALSYVDAAGALRNLEVETAGGTKTFATALTEARAAWQTTFEAAKAVGGDLATTRLFYSALYQSFVMPSRVDDRALPADMAGRYRGFDDAIHFATGFGFYTDLSLWDTYRTAHPLYTLIAPQLQRDVVTSLIAMADESGRLPRWAQGHGHVDSMHGVPAAIVLAETALKNLGGFDENAAYLHAEKALTPTPGALGQECLADYDKVGYCPSDTRKQSVSVTLDYAWADAALAGFAKKRGLAAEAAFFTKRSRNYQNLWEPSKRAFVPRKRNGTFLSDWALTDTSYTGLTESSHHYSEGGANHWRWAVPFDTAGLRALFGSEFVSDLHLFFQKAPQSLGSWAPSSYYWQGNEHDLHAVFLFLDAERNDLSQLWVRWIRTTKYAMGAKGLDGNDDGGTLSAWYALVAMGLYPQNGTSKYWIVAPAFPKMTLTLDGPTNVVIEKDPPGAPYACAATWNGTALPRPEIEHAQLAAGGTLHFVGSARPCLWREAP